MSAPRRVGPLQVLFIGFETSERFRGDIIHELLGLRGRGLLRVLDARLFQPAADGSFVEIDLNPVVADPAVPEANPIGHLMAGNGNGHGHAGTSPVEAVAQATGFSLRDLDRLKQQIEPSELTVIALVEHLWAAHLQDAIREAGGRLLGQGLLTSEVHMLIGDEIQARAEAEAAIEIARAARGAALLEALATLSAQAAPESRTTAATEVVRLLVEKGFVDAPEATGAIEALTTAGLLEAATVEAALSEAEDAVARADPPPD